MRSSLLLSCTAAVILTCRRLGIAREMRWGPVAIRCRLFKGWWRVWHLTPKLASLVSLSPWEGLGHILLTDFAFLVLVEDWKMLERWDHQPQFNPFIHCETLYLVDETSIDRIFACRPNKDEDLALPRGLAAHKRLLLSYWNRKLSFYL